MPGVKRHTLPLLPFERELIEALGCTEEEYRYFASEAAFRSRIRPAGYEHIPDIRCDPVTTSILVSLAIGVVTTAIGYLLTPKPKMPGAQGGVKQRQLASREGLQAFAPTSGFDSQAQLATYGEPIPVIFGRYTGLTGGMLVSPKLVWSRAFSYGTQQGVKQLFVVSEQGVGTDGIDKPDLQGVFLGNTPLDAAFEHTFAFYWRSGTFNGTARIKDFNLRYGTRATPDSGDPETNSDIFLAPTRDSLAEPAFCNAYALNSNAEFGVHSPIYNGTDYRVNWRVVSIPILVGQEDDPDAQLLRERCKIAGTYGYRLGNSDDRPFIKARGQAGTGRGYSRRMGITAINGVAAAANTEVRQVSVGDVCTFTIAPNRIPKNFYYGSEVESTQVDDINSEIDSQCAAADAKMQLGETFQIGYTIWKVINRSLPIWDKGLTQTVTLRCEELLGVGELRRQIGLVSMSMLTDHVVTVESPGEQVSGAPISFYPLMRTQIATIRNTRPCDATEIGIKSQVWNRANGLCNFGSLPSPGDLRRAEEKSIQLNSGTMSLYFKRTSVFAIQVRPAGSDENGLPYPWVPLNNGFCVTSAQPIDIYNFIRIVHVERKQYEYRLVPRSGADTIRHMGATEQVWQLDARLIGESTATLSQSCPTAYGTFTVYAVGRLVTVSSIEFNEEMATNPIFTGEISSRTVPRTVSIQTWFPLDTGIERDIVRQAFKWELFGPYNISNGGLYQVGDTANKQVDYTVNGRTVRIRWSAPLQVNLGSTLFPSETYSRLWGPLTWEVITTQSTGIWNTGETFDATEDLDLNNPFRSLMRGVRVEGSTTGALFGARVRVDSLVIASTSSGYSADRFFEYQSQLADVSFYNNLLNKSNESSPEHVVSYVNEITDNATVPNYDYMVMAGLALKASRTYSSLDQIRMWKDDGIPVQRFHPTEAGTIGPSNLFCDLVYYLLTDKIAGAGNVISPSQIKTADFAATAQFLQTNKLFFDGAITEPSNIREFVSDLAPFFLCNFVIADGLFSIVPALPTVTGGGISTGAVTISALFTSGNILEDSFSIEYLNSEERNSIQAVMRYRYGLKNQFPEERTVIVRWNEADSTSHRIESFDMTQYCTSRDHAVMAAKFLLSVRRRITHTVKFKTSPHELSLAPGQFIRVVTQASPYSGANNGVVGDDGAVTSITALANGSYTILYYKPGTDDVLNGTLTVNSGVTTQADLFGSIFTVTNATTNSNVYLVEQLTLDDDGMVQIAASEYPTDTGYSSRIAQDVLSTTAFVTEG